MAYGGDVARQVLAGLNQLLVQIVRADGIVVPEPCGSIDVVITDSSSSVLAGRPVSAGCAGWLDSICQLVPLMGIVTTAGPIHLWMQGRWDLLGDTAPCRSDEAKGGEVGFSFRGDPPRENQAWAEQYRSDMAQVAKVLAAISGELPGGDLYWQPVRATRGSCVLYHEGLFRLIDANGGAQSPEPLFLALERLGFARLVDHHVLSRVIDELEVAPLARLGANISALSVVCDSLWEETKARLQRTPNVAARLVIEITETAALPDVSSAVRCVTNLRRLGCTIALDDFGAGFASVRQLLALSPDIVKIDKLFLRRSDGSPRNRETFTHLVGLALSLGADVVAEGVETAAQARLALEAGALWQQGYYSGVPSSTRPWRVVSASGGVAAGGAGACRGGISNCVSARRLP